MIFSFMGSGLAAAHRRKGFLEGFALQASQPIQKSGLAQFTNGANPLFCAART